jgi:hypothetical protein
MPKLSQQAKDYIEHVIETTPYGRVIIEIQESSNEVGVIVEGRVTFPKPEEDEKPRAGQMIYGKRHEG